MSSRLLQLSTRVLPVLLVTLLGACANTPGTAGGGALPQITQTQTLKLGYREDARPFSFKGEDGTPTGYSVELCKRVARTVQAQLQLAKLDIQWVPVTAATRVQAAQSGSIDVECGSTTRTLGREQLVDFSNPIWVDGISFVAPTSKRLLRVADLNGKRVGIVPGTTAEPVIKSWAARGVTPVLVPVKTHTEGMAAVRAGNIDAYATDRLILIGEAVGGKPDGKGGEALALGDDYLSVETYSLMMRRDADLRLAVNRALAEIYRTGEIARVFRLSFPPGFEPSPLLESIYLLNALPE